MIKYRGKYRVCYEMDIRTGKALEAVYIPCYLSKKSAIYRHNDNTLNLYISSIIKGRRLLEKYPGIFKAFQVGSHEMT
ncbi:MAG: hypothetical protein N3E37_05735, partial [Candidatus Micrarchaeota archaeon]|nr:hypothetical protein [Candidatus Micrarchaeota archaeon]